MLNSEYLQSGEHLSSEEQLKKQIIALNKINNITGFLPLNIEVMLPVIKREMDKIFTFFECNFNLFNDKFNHCCQMTKDECKAVRDQLPLIIEPGQSHPCCRGKACPGIYVSHVCVPLIAGAEIFGVITLKSSINKKLSRDLLELLLAIANQVAATIQRSQLFNRLAQEKKNLEKANKEITQLNTELVKTIEELKNTQQQLIYSERLAAAGRLAANLTHEINNPTGIILSRLEWLLLEAEEKKITEDIIQDLLVIKKHTERIADTTRNLLQFSRQKEIDFTTIDLNKLIKETVGWLEGQFSRKNILIVQGLNSIPPTIGSAEQLEQVLVNLLANAKDAMPQGGQITIATKYNKEKNNVQIDIKDTGTGIMEGIEDKVFDPFFSTKDKHLGTGLGLPISLAIIKEHGGSIVVNSHYGQGSCFSIILPCQEKEEKYRYGSSESKNCCNR